MKKVVIAFLVAVLVSTAVIGCAQEAAPQPAKTFEFKLANHMAPTHYLTTDVYNKAINEIQTKTNGRVKITMYPSQSLVKATDAYNLVKEGSLDISTYVPTYWPGSFQLGSAVELPFAYPTATIGSKAIWELYKAGNLDQDYAGIKLLYVGASVPYKILLSKKRVATLDDLKGMKIRSPGGLATALLESVGIVPISMPAADAYQALDRGVIEGIAVAFGVSTGYKFDEIVKYGVDIPLCSTLSGIFMSKAAWDSLPKDIQKVFEDVGTAANQWHGQVSDAQEDIGRDVLRKAGREIYTLPSAESEKWAKAAKPIWDSWITNVAKSGLPAQKTYDAFLSILKKEGVKLPY